MDRILVVDDEKKIVNMIAEFMKVNDIFVTPAYSGEEALQVLDNTIKLIILDINMNDLDGIEVCKKIRDKSNVPIIFLTANASQYTKVLGFGMGADDYVTKPFDPIELVARVKAHIRRYKNYDVKNDTHVNIGNLCIDRRAYRVTKNNIEINLSSTEYALLLFFIDNINTVLTRKQILNNVWESDLYDHATVNTYVKRLRDKISDKENRYIRSIRGTGYIFDLSI